MSNNWQGNFLNELRLNNAKEYEDFIFFVGQYVEYIQDSIHAIQLYKIYYRSKYKKRNLVEFL
jgi:hypothetical protein